MKKIIVLLTLVLIHSYCKGQDLPSIQTDRPDQTECPFIVPQNYFQLENGLSFEQIDANTNQIVAPTILTRFGINDHFELRLTTEYIVNTEISNTVSGISPIYVGFKTRLFEEKGIIPVTSFIGQIMLPKMASRQFQTTNYAPEFRFTMQHTLSSKQTLSYNMGAEWDGETPAATFLYTLTTGYSFTEKIGGYIEFYGFFPQFEKPDNRFDAGFTYLINPNQQLDLSGGISLSKTSPDYYVSVGYSFRFKI
ncbi:transporter [Flavobacterium sp. N3904]|uniref:transporter n=1 Tax=Flavobacterium sp. N3904 TaxID=2986835 RepID=UPI00222474AE|nr:transporter [Flavobacterium sp. N3904]